MTLTPEELQRRLDGDDPHSAIQDLADDVKARDPIAPPTPPDPMEDPRNQATYQFEVDWTDARGKRWQGKFTSVIPNIGKQRQAGILQAKLNDGLPKEAIDPITDEINYIIAQSTVRLTQVPKWWKPADLLDVDLMYEVYRHISEHERFFRRLSTFGAEGQGSDAGRSGED